MITLDAIRDCLEGAIPGALATCDLAGVPNVSYLSQVEYVDREHLALSFQFFNTTRRNILSNARAELLLIHPVTAAQYRLALRYLRTEEEGKLFQRMKAKLAGIASHTGMSGVFTLRGADLYKVVAIEQVTSGEGAPPSRPSMLPALRAVTERLGHCADLASLLDSLLDGLVQSFGMSHAMVLLSDPGRDRLYTVGSRGYAASGAGAEVGFGDGVIGVAARERTPIRIGFMTAEYAYSRAIREAMVQEGHSTLLSPEIPLPGLGESRSQLAVPMLAQGELLGVLYLESTEELRFSYDDEDVLVILASQVALAMRFLQATDEPSDDRPTLSPLAPTAGKPIMIRRYPANDTLFLDGDYLIKGVAGRVLWVLLQDYTATGRNEFSNRELRLDPRIRLPALSDNLEARLILLQRRLFEQSRHLRIEKAGRGRIRLVTDRPLQLLEASDA